MCPSFGAAWINTVRHFRTVNPRLRGFAPCKVEIPRVQNEVLCDGCISLSNAEGLGESLRPPRKLVPDTPRTTPKQFVEQMLHRHQKTACLKTGIPASKQTAAFTPLFAAFRLLFALILRAYMPALYYAALYGCPLSLFCSLSAILCSCLLKIWLHLWSVIKKSTKIRLR